MGNGVVTENVIDTSISHNTGGKLPDKVTFTVTQHGITVQIRYHFQINVCMLHCISMISNLMINDTINVEHTLVKNSCHVPRNKSLNIFHQTIRGLVIRLMNYTVIYIMISQTFYVYRNTTG